MKIKVPDIRPDLPTETLRKIDKMLALKIGGYSLSKSYVPGCDCDIVHCDDNREVLRRDYNLWPFPYYTTSIDAALGLCERIDVCISIERNTRGKYLVAVCGKKYKDDPCEICNLSFNQLPCSIVRVLLRSQNVSEIQI